MVRHCQANYSIYKLDWAHRVQTSAKATESDDPGFESRFPDSDLDVCQIFPKMSVVKIGRCKGKVRGFI